MRVRIEAVISTAGNNEEYFGTVLGKGILGRPLKRMVVTFEEDVSDEEFTELQTLSPGSDFERRVISAMICVHAIVVHSLRVSRNFQN